MRAAAARLALAGTLLAGSFLAACSDEGDSEAFCDRIGDTTPVAEVLAELDSSDPGGSRRRLQRGIEEFQALEAAAPGEIRGDLARLRRGVELVLEAIEDNPDDLPAAREAITGRQDELSGLFQAGERVVSYARDECGVSLDDPDGTGSPGGTDTTAGGSEPDGTGTGGIDGTDGEEVEPKGTDPDATTGTSLDEAPDSDGSEGG